MYSNHKNSKTKTSNFFKIFTILQTIFTNKYVAIFKIARFYKTMTFEKNCHLYWTVTGQISLKHFLKFSFVNFGADFYCFKSKSFFEVPTLPYKVIFATLCFYLRQLRKCISDFENTISNWTY